jgi:RNA polymerase sigma factor (sigma-70 family)
LNISEKEFLEKIEQHKGILLKVSRIYCADPEDQNDLTQEIILQLWQSIKRFKQECAFSTWMYQVAINTALVSHKHDKKRPDNVPLSNNDGIAKEPYGYSYEHQLEQFYRAAESLNKVEKALILLYIDGYSSEQMAHSLGISATNARVKVNRIKNKLKHIIEANKHEH